MRSRYSAFCLNKVNYLIDTLHPDKRQLDDKHTLKQSIEDTQWLGLKIIKQSSSSTTVEFVAFYKEKTVIAQLHERSNFIKKDKQWFYVDGELLPAIKLARNEVCFCGSAKKFKKCHGRT